MAWDGEGWTDRAPPPQDVDRFLKASEFVNISAVSGGRVKSTSIEAQSTAIAQAMASICNKERGRFGVQGGHGRNVHKLSALHSA